MQTEVELMLFDFVVQMLFNCCLKDFDRDYKSFQENVADFDQRLSRIFHLVFQDCSGLESIFKVRLLYLLK